MFTHACPCTTRKLRATAASLGIADLFHAPKYTLGLSLITDEGAKQALLASALALAKAGMDYHAQLVEDVFDASNHAGGPRAQHVFSSRATALRHVCCFASHTLVQP